MVAEIGGSTVDKATRRMIAFPFEPPLTKSSILLAGMERERFEGSNCLRLYEVYVFVVRLFTTFMCKQRLFDRVEFVLRKSNQFD